MVDLEGKLYAASWEGRIEIVKAILEVGRIDINAGCASNGNTALMVASEHGHDSICKLLLECEGIRVGAQNVHGTTALMCATGAGEISTIALLLHHGADVNDASGGALLFAIIEGQEAAAHMLLCAGADVSLKPDGYTLLSACARYQQDGYLSNAVRSPSEEIARMLIHHGADLNVKDDLGNTALHFASSYGRSGICELFLAQGSVDVNAKNKDGETALFLAAYNGRYEICEILLQQDCIDVNAGDVCGRTALIVASSEGHCDVFELLVAFLEKQGFIQGFGRLGM